MENSNEIHACIDMRDVTALKLVIDMTLVLLICENIVKYLKKDSV